MKRVIIFICLLFCLMTVMTIGGNDDRTCKGGDCNPPKENKLENISDSDATLSEQLSYELNEVIGHEGYDSVRWVSINDVMNYTILFENDPEFATAAAQKVDVRFDFADKKLIF